MKLLTLEDYQKASVNISGQSTGMLQKELGENFKTEDILKVMETLGGVALQFKNEEESAGPFGFNKKTDEQTPEEERIVGG